MQFFPVEGGHGSLGARGWTVTLRLHHGPDPHIVVFTALCNPLPLNGGRTCKLFLTESGKTIGCHFYKLFKFFIL